jgi:hypothetical protein
MTWLIDFLYAIQSHRNHAMNHQVTQLTQEEAVNAYETEAWRNWAPEVRASFQLYQDRLCMPIGVFMESLSQALGRPVFTHELAFPSELKAELEGRKGAPTFEDIVNLLPKEKTIVVIQD